MPFRLAPAVLTRLRASTRLTALVLMVFLLKVGVVAACATDDFGGAGLSPTEHASASVAVDTGDDGQPPEPLSSGGCVDCHCHHVATLVPDVLPRVTLVPATEPPIVAVSVRTVCPGQELRPPIL